jgi:hypothetical protein
VPRGRGAGRAGCGGPGARLLLGQHRLDLVDQGFQPLGRGGPLGEVVGELVGALADLQDRRVYLVGGGFLLLGGEQGFPQHGGGGGHQVADLAGLAGALFGGHDGGVGLVADPGDDDADRFGGAQ